MFKEFGMVFLIILVHELGHLGAALFLKWNTGKIIIYPFGGCCKFDEKINRSLKEEFIILLCGPIVQIIFCLIIEFCTTKGLMTYRNFLIFQNYHYTLLIFNLLPVYPLDGGRILNIFFNCFMPFKKGNKIVVFISMLIILVCVSYYRNLNFTLMGFLILGELLLYLKRQDFLYNRMLLERYIGNFSFKKIKKINNKENMYKNCRHVIWYIDKYITEKSYLKERFRVKK